MDRKTAWGLGLAGFLAATLAAGWLLYDTLLPLFVAFALSYAFSPPVNWLHERGFPRGAAVLTIMLALALGLVLAVGSFLPVFLSDAQQFAANFPDYFASAVRKATELGHRYGVPIPVNQQELLDRARGWLEGVSLTALKPVALFAHKFFTGTVSIVVAVLNVLLIPVFFYYVLEDFPRIKRYVLELVPTDYRDLVLREIEKADRVFSGYIRGMMSVGLILAVIFSIGLTLMGVKFGLFIGILSGFLTIVPYLGQITGFALSMIMVLVDFTGWGRLVAVPILFGLTNYIEGTFITPRIVGDKVGLSPVQTILALIVGGQIAGFLGLLVAIPVAGCIKALLLDVIQEYKKSELYRGAKV